MTSICSPGGLPTSQTDKKSDATPSGSFYLLIVTIKCLESMLNRLVTGDQARPRKNNASVISNVARERRLRPFWVEKHVIFEK